MAAVAASEDTRARVLRAATALFAARGYRATTIRDIAARARVNVASGHYHFGSKRSLYLEVLRQQFAAIRRTLETREGPAGPGRGRRALEQRFRTRVQTMLDLQIGPESLPHAALLHREMADPSEALGIIVREFMTPMMTEMSDVLAQLAPGLPPKTIERCTLSVAGQAVFFFTIRPALLERWGLRAYPPGFTKEVADHITAFSLGGLDRIARRGRRGAR